MTKHIIIVIGILAFLILGFFAFHGPSLTSRYDRALGASRYLITGAYLSNPDAEGGIFYAKAGGVDIMLTLVGPLPFKISQLPLEVEVVDTSRREHDIVPNLPRGIHFRVPASAVKVVSVSL